VGRRSPAGFLDEVVLEVHGGRGGDGCVAFHREKYVPRGGPSGGDGGRGGSVVLRATEQRTTFHDLGVGRIVRARPGEPGLGGKRAGKDAQDRVVLVPEGTTVTDEDTGRVVGRLLRAGDEVVVARGGNGGRGNARFASATDQAPRRATPGGEGQARRVRLELRLLADVGLVGLPNAGKSTLLARLSRARPRVADYPFTTLAPHLGVVERADFRRLTVADLPGLVGGAHEGRGLGHRFLRHVERTRVLLHLVDLFPPAGDPASAYRTVRAELEAYGQGLETRTEVVAGTKADAGAAAAPLRRLRRAVGRPVLAVSAVTGEGLEALLEALARAVDDARGSPDPEEGPRGRRPDAGAS
jgi:GTP-binding protein